MIDRAIARVAMVLVIFMGPIAVNAAPVQCGATDPLNDNYYEVVLASDPTWVSANAAADASDFVPAPGQVLLPGHLATITSALENKCIIDLWNASPGSGKQAWIGGFQDPAATTPGAGWSWVNNEGPISTSSFPISGAYSNWLGGEPNDGDNTENDQEDQLTIGIFGLDLWNDSFSGVGAIGGYIVEYTGSADANTCQGASCNPSRVQEVELPDSVELDPDDTLTQGLVTNASGVINFTDPRVDPLGQCSDRRELDVFGDRSLILPDFLCGSPEFAVLLSDASFEVVRDVIRSEQLPEAIFTETFECTPLSPMSEAEKDLQRRGVFAWQPEDRTTVAEMRVLELTNGCGSSRGATRGLSWFVLNLHIDCNITFGTDHPGVLQCFIDLTNDKFAVLDQSLKNAKKSLISPKYGKLRSQLSSARDGFEDGNYAKALQRLAKFISRVEAAEFDTSSGFNFQGNLLMRAENIEFIIDEKIRLAP